MIDVGHKIRDYEIVARLKAGGMATLFLARRTGAAGFARHVAIKVVHPHLATDQQFVRMFVDEAKLSARIQHPNVVHIEELGEAGGTYFLVMEYVHGSALATLLAALSRLQRRLQPELAVWLAMRVAEGLHAAHETTDENGQPLGVVHRDVSPQNVLVSSSGHVKLIDFGIAKAATSSRRTETGALKGKIRYMPPEQAYGQAIDRRADVYALGIVLWEMLTMQRMFRAGNDLALLDEVRNPQIEPPSHLAPDLPPSVDAVVMCALARDPANRPQTAYDFKKMLSDALPAANAVDPSQLKDVVAAILGERMEARRRELPDSLSLSGIPGAGAPADRSLDAPAVLRSMTVSSPGAKYQSDGEGSLDAPADPQRGFTPPPGSHPGSTPMTSSVIVPAPGGRDRMIAIVAGAVALLAMGVVGGLLLGRGNDPVTTATPLSPTALPVVTGAPQPQVALVPDAGPPAAVPEVASPEPERATPHDRPRGGHRGGHRGGSSAQPPDPDHPRQAVDGVPIYDDPW